MDTVHPLNIERDEAIKLLVNSIVQRDYPEGTTYQFIGEPDPSKIEIEVHLPTFRRTLNVNWSLIPTGEDPDDYK